MHHLEFTCYSKIILIMFQNFSVELQIENKTDFQLDFFREQLLKASGANYGTGVRDL